MDEQQALKMMKVQLNEMKDKLERNMDLETYHLFESLRMHVNGKIKLD